MFDKHVSSEAKIHNNLLLRMSNAMADLSARLIILQLLVPSNKPNPMDTLSTTLWGLSARPIQSQTQQNWVFIGGTALACSTEVRKRVAEDKGTQATGGRSIVAESYH